MNSALSTSFVVAKFGGTSVADYTSMCRCADIVLNDPSVNVVIVSASAGITNLLIALAEGRSSEIRQQHLKKIADLQYAILDELPNNNDIQRHIDTLLNHVRVLSEAAGLASSAALTDELVAHGELLSSALFTEVLKQKSARARWFDVRQVMRTDATFGKANPQIKIVRQLSCAYLKSSIADDIIVTQGFIGSDAHGRTTTLGRGGSDYSAALLGEALSATKVAIWSDVAGIHTTDPNVVKSAQPIYEMTFSEAAEMASFGAKILHPATLIPAMRSNIPLFVGSSQIKDAPGTWIGASTITRPLFRAITLRRVQTLVTLYNFHHRITPNFLTAVFGIMAKYHITVDLVSTSEVGIAFIIDPNGSHTDNRVSLIENAIQDLTELGQVEREENYALVTLIGNHFPAAKGQMASVFEALSTFPVRLSCFGTSMHSLCLLVRESDANHVVQTLHAQLFESDCAVTTEHATPVCVSY